MSEMPEVGQIPEWTLGWRMQRALAHAGISVNEIADEMGVSRATISRWINDKGTAPRTIYLREWALRTGVPYEWLSGDPSPRGGLRAQVSAGFNSWPKSRATHRHLLTMSNAA